MLDKHCLEVEVGMLEPDCRKVKHLNPNHATMWFHLPNPNPASILFQLPNPNPLPIFSKEV